MPVYRTTVGGAKADKYAQTGTAVSGGLMRLAEMRHSAQIQERQVEIETQHQENVFEAEARLGDFTSEMMKYKGKLGGIKSFDEIQGSDFYKEAMANLGKDLPEAATKEAQLRAENQARQFYESERYVHQNRTDVLAMGKALAIRTQGAESDSEMANVFTGIFADAERSHASQEDAFQTSLHFGINTSNISYLNVLSDSKDITEEQRTQVLQAISTATKKDKLEKTEQWYATKDAIWSHPDGYEIAKNVADPMTGKSMWESFNGSQRNELRKETVKLRTQIQGREIIKSGILANATDTMLKRAAGAHELTSGEVDELRDQMYLEAVQQWDGGDELPSDYKRLARASYRNAPPEMSSQLGKALDILSMSNNGQYDEKAFTHHWKEAQLVKREVGAYGLDNIMGDKANDYAMLETFVNLLGSKQGAESMIRYMDMKRGADQMVLSRDWLSKRDETIADLLSDVEPQIRSGLHQKLIMLGNGLSVSGLDTSTISKQLERVVKDRITDLGGYKMYGGKMYEREVGSLAGVRGDTLGEASEKMIGYVMEELHFNGLFKDYKPEDMRIFPDPNNPNVLRLTSKDNAFMALPISADYGMDLYARKTKTTKQAIEDGTDPSLPQNMYAPGTDFDYIGAGAIFDLFSGDN